MLEDNIIDYKKNNYNQLDIKLRQITQVEFYIVVLTNIKNNKAANLDAISPEIWKTRNFDDIIFLYCNAVIKKRKYTIDRGTKSCNLPFS